MQRYFDVVQNRQGTAVVGATVTVFDANGNLATLYSSPNSAPTSNPVYTNMDGEYAFYAANGTYTLQITATNYATETKPGVVLFDPADAGVPSVFSVGVNTGAFGTGLQIGGNGNYGANGNLFSPDGHYSWTRIQPSANESSVELLIYPTSAQGRASTAISTNQVTRVSGTPFSSAWVGKKFYLGSDIFIVAAVSSQDSLTVTLVGGGAVSFTSNFTETFHLFSVQGSGLCNVSGTTVTRISGDPFIPFMPASFEFKINGVTRTVASFVDVNTVTISTPLSLTNAAYSFSLDINDQISTLRLQKMLGADEENLSIFSRYDGYWVHALFAGAGQYRKIVFGSGERQSGILARQLVAQANGDITIGGDFGNEAIRVLNQAEISTNRFEIQAAPTGFAPAWRSRGIDANVPFGLDMKGSGELQITQDFSRTLLKVQGGGNTVNWLNIAAEAAGSPPNIFVDNASGDANVDIKITPKGAGVVRVGNWTSNADAPVNGYITIKDAAGNLRKLATIA